MKNFFRNMDSKTRRNIICNVIETAYLATGCIFLYSTYNGPDALCVAEGIGILAGYALLCISL